MFPDVQKNLRSYRSGGFGMLFLEPRKQFDAKSYVKFNKRSYRVGGFGMFFGSRGIWMLAVSGRAKTLKIV